MSHIWCSSYYTTTPHWGQWPIASFPTENRTLRPLASLQYPRSVCVRPRRMNLFFPVFLHSSRFFPGKNHWRLRTQLGKPRCRDPQKHQCRDHKNPQCLHSKNPIAATTKTPMPTLENPIVTTQKTPMPALENPIACTPDVAAAQCLHT